MEQSFLNAWNSPKFQALRRTYLARYVRDTVGESCAAKG